MLTQQPAALLVWQQVPVVRAHERIHADVTERALPREKCRHVRAVELGGSVHADVRPHRLEPPCALLEHGTVRRLQRLRGRRVCPQHEIGICAKPREVVPAANREPFDAAQASLDRLDRLGAGRSDGSPLGEHRIDRVVGRLVDTFGDRGVIDHRQI